EEYEGAIGLDKPTPSLNEGSRQGQVVLDAHLDLVDLFAEGDEPADALAAAHREVEEGPGKLRAAPLPGQHDGDEDCGNGDGEVSAAAEFQEGGEEEEDVDREEGRADEEDLEGTPAPAVVRDVTEGQGRDSHGPGDRDSVGGGEVSRGTEDQSDGHAADEHGP